MNTIPQRAPLKSYINFVNEQRCCFCGQPNCTESVDHDKIQLPEIQSLIQNHKSNQQQVNQIKAHFSRLYKQLKMSIISFLDQDQFKLQIELNKFFFNQQFIQKNKFYFQTISEVMDNNVTNLPQKNIKKIFKNLAQSYKSAEVNDLKGVQEKLKRIQKELNLEDSLQCLKSSLPFAKFSEQKDILKLKPKRSISQVTNPEEAELGQFKKPYFWKNVKITQNSKTIALSNKNLTDRDVMEQIFIIAAFSNLKQLQIRNNKISSLTCSLIANNMPFLSAVDIRGNKINDKGIIKIINGIPRLKSLSISQTDASDQSGLQIADKLPQLEMLWSEHTNISNQIALKIAQKPKLKVLSFLGNPIDDQYKQKMKKLFISKGYINV